MIFYSLVQIQTEIHIKNIVHAYDVMAQQNRSF